MRFRYRSPNDKSIFSGGFGSVASFNEPSSGGPSYPEAGTILSTEYGVTYPIANGGSSVTYGGIDYPNQNCDVNVVANGSGGSYYDWINATNIAYKTGTFTTYTSSSADIIINGTSYGAGCTYYGDVNHNGSGGYEEVGTSGGCATGLITTGGSGSNSISTPVGSFTYETWDNIEYYHDGMGGYTSSYVNYNQATDGTYIGTDSNGGTDQLEVPTGSSSYWTYGTYVAIDYYYQLDGNTYNGIKDYSGSLVNDGDYIYFDGTYDYYWNVTTSPLSVSYRDYP